MDEPKPLTSAFNRTANFSIHQVDSVFRAAAHAAVAPAALPLVLPPTLGPLSAFAGTFTGQGFNTIFRPDSATTPTQMPGPITTTDPPDNVLELNLTDETMSFSNSLGSIPNRGSGPQADAFLNGVPYLQTINDVTTGTPVGIHFEPGIWLAVPSSTNPNEPFTLARMASIPHGTTITAQGAALPAVAGKPTIAPIDITPFFGGNPANKFTFQNQTAANKTTRRLPQDLTALIASGKLTQAMITDPNTVLRHQIAHQTIHQTIIIETSTKPGTPLSGGPLPAVVSPGPHPQAPNFAGGTANIAFLQGVPAPPPGGNGANANAFQMDAVFWIETVIYDVDVPHIASGEPPIILQPVQKSTVPLVPSFVASLPLVPGKGFAGGRVKVATTQIQYSQKVMLDFNGLTWPHVSVASLVPAAPVPIPEHLLPLS
ncbi:heme-binding protein [Bradyrhizobium sp. CCGUVB14]|uniref:heme-binding protein n=1 Tax=Bradyrhizobium sp. CCGUVB14 TaxID=2949628 RepID=UPI0020B2CA1F|nr:heme-binding protein [Bradyrhizobium sp. CCGUVB14]MCP3447706.1 heme-binding protein [Bradyrhizobium sp. CCGUVB14]